MCWCKIKMNMSSGQKIFENVADAFEQGCGFPGVIGAIDGTHIPLVGVGKTGHPSSIVKAF